MLLVLGVFPLVMAIGLLQRRPWAWFGAFAVGCGLIIFELVEYEVIGYNVAAAYLGFHRSADRAGEPGAVGARRVRAALGTAHLAKRRGVSTP